MKVHCVVCSGVVVRRPDGTWRHRNPKRERRTIEIVDGRTGKKPIIGSVHSAVPLEVEARHG